MPFVLLTSMIAAPSSAQVPDSTADDGFSREGYARVFLDCGACDNSYIRREITFVNYVRERQLADVHVLITTQETGSGGREFTIDLIGLNGFAGQDYNLSYVSNSSDSEDDVRRGLVRILEIGLVPYFVESPLLDRMDLTFDEAEDAASEPVDDRWNNWVFEVYLNAWADKEARQTEFDTRYGFYADRVTEQWKIRLRPYFNYSFEEYEQDDETITSTSRRDGFDTYAIRSISDHWSIGAFGEVFSSTFSNIKLRLQGGPGVEYSFFPYAEASRRQLTAAYVINFSDVQYRDTTIFGEISEVLISESIDANLELTQPWGSIDVGLEGSHYFHDLSKYRIEFDSGVSLRLARGLALSVGANVELIHDQLNLAKGDASLEEILLRQRQLATTYQFSASVGFRYTFGSIYNNVVNTRF